MKTFVFLIISLLLIQTPYSQSDSTYILPRLKIYHKEKGKVVYYSFENYKYNRFTLSDSFLTADPLRYNYKVKINDIDHISFQSGRDFWGGAKVMGAVGYTLGFLLAGFGGPFGWTEEPYFRIGPAIFGGFIGAVPFGLLGGLIGLLAPAYDDYDVSKVPDYAKELYLKKVIKKNRLRL